MPIYAYECNECGVRFERRQSFSDDPIAICPECGGEVRRLLQPAVVIFKGSGFYVNDSKGSNPALSAGKKTESDDSSTTSKPDTTKDKPSKSSASSGENK